MRTKAICIALTLILCLSVFCTATGETGLAEHRDDCYSFSYPADWKEGTARDGSTILEVPGGKSAVLTFAVKSDLIRYTGDPETDSPMAEISIGEYAEEKARASGKNTSLSGKYELIDVGEMHGFRATGTWLATGWDLVMIVLTDDHVMVSFELIGDEAIAQEQVLLDTLKTYGESAADGSAGGFLRSDGEQFAIDYPDTYSMMDYGLKDGCAVRMFANAGDPNNLYMARTYILDQEYSDALAPSIASMGLPKSAKVEAEPEMVRIGSRNAAVILGNTEAGPLAFYVIGSGRTALAVLFMGEEATGMAEQIMASAEIK